MVFMFRVNTCNNSNINAEFLDILIPFVIYVIVL